MYFHRWYLYGQRQILIALMGLFSSLHTFPKFSHLLETRGWLHRLR
jgi:hypothetical protein